MSSSSFARRSLLALSGTVALGGTLAACSPVQVLNSLAPSRLSASGIAYADGPRHRLDVYVPAGPPKPWPVVVFIYGGGWDNGSRAMYPFVGGALAAHGLVTVIPDYRLYPDVLFPSFLQDCAAAVRWTRDNIAQFGGAPGPVFLMGHSAGAYNAAMLGLDAQWLGQHGMTRSDLRGVIGLAGPYDFLPLNTDELRTIFGPQDQLARTQPINFVDGGQPPMLLLTGDKDITVKPGNSARLAARIREKGGLVEERVYPGIGHLELIGSIGHPLRFLAPTLRDCVRFMGAAAG